MLLLPLLLLLLPPLLLLLPPLPLLLLRVGLPLPMLMRHGSAYVHGRPIVLARQKPSTRADAIRVVRTGTAAAAAAAAAYAISAHHTCASFAQYSRAVSSTCTQEQQRVSKKNAPITIFVMILM
jgi:hypothetical protein